MDLTVVLEATVSPDKTTLEEAQKALEQAAQTNLWQFLYALAEILADNEKTAVARMQAAIQLKNALYSKDASVRTTYQQRWLSGPEDGKAAIKAKVMQTLGTENTRPSSAAQCVAYIACAELPVGQAPDLIQTLMAAVTNPAATEMQKEATLEAIGYICADIEADILEAQSNEILTAIINGMRKEEPSNNVRLAATNALLNSLEFTRANFEKDTERNVIMQVVCETTQSTNIQIKVAALQCLVKIMSLYYQHMGTYMGPALFAITLDAIKSDVDEVALQGIEFWSNVCDEEVDLVIEQSEAQEQGRLPERNSMFYAKGAMAYIIPLLTETLTKQEEFDDDDEWNPCKAAGVCLMLMATCCEDAILPLVLAFVNENINAADWQKRDAAVMSFGSVLEGPDPTQLRPITEQAFPVLLEKLKDPSVVVRDTAAWTVGRVCEIIPDAVLSTELSVDALVGALLTNLDAEPRVSTNICWAFSSLAEAAFENANAAAGDDGAEPQTYCLSKHFKGVVEKLLLTTNRADASQNNLRSAAYEALMELIKNSPKDCYETVQQTTLEILNRLQVVLQMESAGGVAGGDRAQFNDLQSLLCATLQSVLRKMTPDDAPKISDAIMAALLQMLSGSNAKGGVQEDALLAVSTLIEVLGDNFIKYMDSFKPFLSAGLQNHEEYQVCQAAVGVSGDICRSLGNKLLPYADEIMNLLVQNISNVNVHRSVKPQILSVFGDVALATGAEFKKYLEVVLTTLQQASAAQVEKTDYDMIDYLNELRESCLEGYTGIVQGLKGDSEAPNGDIQLLAPHVPHMLQFLEHVATDTDHSDGVIAASCGLIGDLCTAFGALVLAAVDKDVITAMMTQGRRSKTGKTKTLATWATREIRKLRNASSS